MMKALARFLLSLELLFSHPGKWWRERSWLVKGTLLLLTIAIINGSTLWVYNRWGVHPDNQATQLNNQDGREVALLRQQIAELKQQQQDLKESLAGRAQPAMATVSEASPSPLAVGGVAIDNLPADDPEDLATESARIVFLPAEKGETTPLYKQADRKSAVVTTISTDTWYLIVNKRPGWYQIEVDEDGRIGWIPESVAVEQGLE